MFSCTLMYIQYFLSYFKTYEFFFLCTVFNKLDLSPLLKDLGKDDSKGCFVS